MTCMEAQAMITSFINNQLDIMQTEHFFEHLKGCKNCQEELEVYYALLTAMQQLDDDKNLSNSYEEELYEKISEWEEKIKHSKMLKLKRRFNLLFMIIGIGIILGIELGGKIASEYDTTVRENTNPSFLLKYSGVPEVKDNIKVFIQTYDKEAREYSLLIKEARERLQIKMREDLNQRFVNINIGNTDIKLISNHSENK